MTESQRIWKEFQRLYELKPELNVRANDGLFLDYARESGGTELFSAENAILWLDDPALKSRLAVLQETPTEALKRFMRENPWYDCVANHRIISERIRQTNESPEQAALALTNQLAFNQEKRDAGLAQAEADEQAALAKRQQNERVALIEEIALDYSSAQHAQDLQRRRMQGFSTEALIQEAQRIRDRRRFRQMSNQELKTYLREQREQNTPPPLELPAEFTAQTIRQMEPEEIRKLIRMYGKNAVNARLGYVKPEFGGMIRNVNLEL